MEKPILEKRNDGKVYTVSTSDQKSVKLERYYGAIRSTIRQGVYEAKNKKNATVTPVKGIYFGSNVAKEKFLGYGQLLSFCKIIKRKGIEYVEEMLLDNIEILDKLVGNKGEGEVI